MHETVLPAELGVSPFADVGRDGGIGGSGGACREFELVHKSGHRIAAEARLFATGSGPDWTVGGFIVDARTRGPGVGRAGLPCGAACTSRTTRSPTGLPNRARLRGKADRCGRYGAGTPGGVAAVLLDIDRFKAINDTMGHDTGDLLLALVAQRLARVAGDAD